MPGIWTYASGATLTMPAVAYSPGARKWGMIRDRSQFYVMARSVGGLTTADTM